MHMQWTEMAMPAALDTLLSKSFQRAQLIFKHSTRCSVSTMAKSRLERASVPDNLDCHYLDLLRYRDLSTEIAQRFSVPHESPQVLLIVNGSCIYSESHNGISMNEIADQIPS